MGDLYLGVLRYDSELQEVWFIDVQWVWLLTDSELENSLNIAK